MTDLESWKGKAQTREAVIDKQHANLLSVTLDQPQLNDGDVLPHCWHWGWFNDTLPPTQLGRDGHPEKGGFLPPVNLPRRMWAGGNLEFRAPVRVGKGAVKKSTIENISEKNGKSGKLCIVTVAHDIFQDETLCVSEKQNLVYREDPKPDAPPPQLLTPPENASVERTVSPDPVLMFRYSAVTFNGHRIHYDADYARTVEGYPGLVFHAPLTATLLCTLAQDIVDGAALKKFEYRATAPLFSGEDFLIKGKKENGAISVWAETPQGGLAMTAHAEI